MALDSKWNSLTDSATRHYEKRVFSKALPLYKKALAEANGYLDREDEFFKAGKNPYDCFAVSCVNLANCHEAAGNGGEVMKCYTLTMHTSRDAIENKRKPKIRRTAAFHSYLWAGQNFVEMLRRYNNWEASDASSESLLAFSEKYKKELGV
jgi:hypothetical protein